MKINISFKKQDVGKEETPTSNDLFFSLKEKRLGNITDTGRKIDCSRSNLSPYFVTVFFSTVIKFYSPVKICHYLNRVQRLQLSHNCDNENRQCADNQCS